MSKEATPQRTKRLVSAVSYILAGGLLALGLCGAVRGAGWSLSLLVIASGVTIFIGMGRPIYRTAIYRRSSQEIVCRFFPWYQATGLVMAVIMPAFGIAAIAQGAEPDSPFWLSYGGWLLLVLGLVFLPILLLMAARNRLTFTPSALDLRKIRFERHIARENVESITTRMVPSAFSSTPTMHVDLNYTVVNGNGPASMTARTIDTQFTVETANLLAALQAWKDADPAEHGLMDRIEAVLRGTETRQSQ